MSNISNRHQINLFVPGKSQALNDQRLAKIGWKTTKNVVAKFKNICVSVPVISDQDIQSMQEALLPYVRTMLANAQDGIIRSLYESSEGTRNGVNDDEISVNACIAFLESQESGGRLTKVQIENWFDTQMKDALTIRFAEKLGFTLAEENEKAEMEVIGKHLNAYKALFSSLAGGKTFLQASQITGLESALSLIDPDDSGISEKLQSRLDAMKTPKDIAELLEI